MARNWLYAGQRVNGNGASNFFWSPMSLNHPGKLINNAGCGGEYKSDNRFTVGGKCGLSGEPFRTQLCGCRFGMLSACCLGPFLGPQLLPA